MDEQKKILIIFTGKADLVLSDIIKKYSLQETDLETFEKYKAGKLPKIVIIDHLTGDFALKIISEKDLIVSLQKELEISQQTAEKISKDIINSLVPLLEKVSEDQLENYNGITPQEMKQNSIPTTEELVNNSVPLPKKQPRIKKTIIEESITEPISQQKRKNGPDSYREPIE